MCSAGPQLCGRAHTGWGGTPGGQLCACGRGIHEAPHAQAACAPAPQDCGRVHGGGAVQPVVPYGRQEDATQEGEQWNNVGVMLHPAQAMRSFWS